MHRRITALSDVRVALSPDGARVKSAQVRLTTVEAIDLFGVTSALIDNCSPAVLDRLHASLDSENDPVKLGIYCAILWWERCWTCDSEWEMEDCSEHWDPIAVELLERLFV
jgi:hypothetical protein